MVPSTANCNSSITPQSSRGTLTRQLLLVHLLRIVLDHLHRLAGDRSDLGGRTACFNQEYDRTLAQSVKNQTDAPERPEDASVHLGLPVGSEAIRRPWATAAVGQDVRRCTRHLCLDDEEMRWHWDPPSLARLLLDYTLVTQPLMLTNRSQLLWSGEQRFRLAQSLRQSSA